MNESAHTKPSSATTSARLLFAKRWTRLVLFFVLAFVAAAVVTTTLVLAGTLKKPKKNKPEMTLRTEPRLKRNDSERFSRKTPGTKNNTTRRATAAQKNDDGLFLELQPTELRLVKAHEFNGDLRQLPRIAPVRQERPEREGPTPGLGGILPGAVPPTIDQSAPVIGLFPPAPSTIQNFNGLDFLNWGAGRPPDTNGDVGPNHFIQSVNTSIGIFSKTGGLITALTFNNFMSQGSFGNLCDTNNFGDPVVLYDSFEDRWIITDFAFTLDGSGNVTSNAFQCFAASKTGDPVAGGWNFYSLVNTDLLNDYPKFGIWPDGLYMSANMFGFPASSSFSNVRVWALNKAQMYAGDPSVQVVSFNAPSSADGGSVFTLLPGNARLQTGTPLTGTPNYFASMFAFTNAMSVWKFHVDWTRISTSTFTGPFYSFTATSWLSPPGTVPAQGGNNNDTLAIRFMMQNQYSNLGGLESLWDSHTVRGSSPTQAAVRYYQVDVTGGTVAANATQAATHNPDTDNRYMPSVAVDRAGNMAIGYSVSNSTLFPAIRYAGRLATDAINTLQTETSLIAGTGSQNVSTRWGDYSTMTLDPDGCTFWFTNEYYAVTGNDWQTRVGSFRFPAPQCTTVASGTISGTVTAAAGGAPISGATVALGSRITTTDGSGFYSFAGIPSGTYPSETASSPGFNSGSVTNIVVTDSTTTTKDFSLTTAPTSGCLVDTSQSDFQTGVPTSVDLTASPGNVVLLNAPNLDQQNTTLGGFGVGITTTTWGGQTFTPAVTGQLAKADINLFCSMCGGTTPNLTLSVRATSGGVPTGADLASATLPGFSSGASAYYTGTFATPPTLTAGTMYALVIRPTANPSAGTYALTRSGTMAMGADVYAGGTRVAGTSSGTVWSIPSTGGVTSDAGFRTYMQTGFTASGVQVSSLKDANPPPGNFIFWSTISWNATVPANTTLRFQVAASNNAAGPFNFVGPDGTAATFYTSPGSVLQFNGNRYLQYKAYLNTTDSAVTPTLNDVTLCFNNPPTAASAMISGRITDASGNSLAGVLMRLDGAASARTITDSNGRYQFDEVATNSFYTVTPSFANYHFSPANRSFSLLGNKSDAVFTGTADSIVTANAIDSTEYFVRQQYLDFLGREPDRGGFAYWTGDLAGCNGVAACLNLRRIDVSAAFFAEREFQETGSFIFRLYKSALGRQLGYGEFSLDRQQVVAGPNLDQSKAAFALAFVQRAEFLRKYQNNNSAASFVDALLQTMRGATGVDLASERTNLINEYNSGTSLNESRALVVRELADNGVVSQALYNGSFVLMEYFAYLRRDPDQGGYDFWLDVLNNRQPGNYRGMVCAFLTSVEYQRRFGPLVTRTNADCGRRNSACIQYYSRY